LDEHIAGFDLWDVFQRQRGDYKALRRESWLDTDLTKFGWIFCVFFFYGSGIFYDVN